MTTSAETVIGIGSAAVPLDVPGIRPHYATIAKLALLASDAIMLAVAFALAYWLRFGANIGIKTDVEPSLFYYTVVVALLIPLWLVLFATLGLYDFRNLLGGISEYSRALNACTSGMMVVVVVSFVFEPFVVARGWLLMSWLFTTILVCTGRFCLRRVAYSLRHQGYFVSRAVIVGTNEEAIALAMQLHDMRYSGVAVLGYVDTHETNDLSTVPHEIVGQPVFGFVDALQTIVKERRVELVIVASTALNREQLISLPMQLAQSPSVEMYLSSGLYEVFTTGMSVSHRAGVPLMTLNRLRLHPLEMLMKTAMDYLLTLSAAIILIPVFAVISLLIKLDSPGPIFYRRRVLGVSGREFDALKFRTMVVNGDEVLARYPELLAKLRANHKLTDDPRVTRVGRWLRRTSLDELPQLINVLLGQMSLVGPRMISPKEYAEYGRMQLNLLTVKPGITGLWQVSGRSDLTYAERVQLDMHYIRNYSFWLDVQILFFQTLPAVFRGRGAY